MREELCIVDDVFYEICITCFHEHVMNPMVSKVSGLDN